MNKIIYTGIFVAVILITFWAGFFQVNQDLPKAENSSEINSPSLSNPKNDSGPAEKKRIQVHIGENVSVDQTFKEKLQNLSQNNDFKEMFERLKSEYSENENYAAYRHKFSYLGAHWFQNSPDEFVAMLQEMATDIKNKEYLMPLLEGMTNTLLKEDPKLALEKLDEIFGTEKSEHLAYLGASTLYSAVEINLVEPQDILRNMDVIQNENINELFSDRILSIWAGNSKQEALKSLEWFKENKSSFKENEAFIIALANYANDKVIRNEILALAIRDDDKEDAYKEIVSNMINKDIDQTIKWFSEQAEYKKYEKAGTEIVRGLAKNQRFTEAVKWTSSWKRTGWRCGC